MLAAYVPGIGTDAEGLLPLGVPSTSVGFPVRYMHSPVEMADLADVRAVVDVLTDSAAASSAPDAPGRPLGRRGAPVSQGGTS